MKKRQIEREGPSKGVGEGEGETCNHPLRPIPSENMLYEHDSHSINTHLLSAMLEIFLSPPHIHSPPLSTWTPRGQMYIGCTNCTPLCAGWFSRWEAPAGDEGGKRVKSENWFPGSLSKGLPWAGSSPWIKWLFTQISVSPVSTVPLSPSDLR